MIKINIVCVGKIKEKYFADAVEEYRKRLTRFCEITISEVKEENFTNEPTESEIKKIIELEGEKILKQLKGYIVVMAIKGEKLSSISLANKIKNYVSNGKTNVTFVIGGSYGLSQSIIDKADEKMSFSDMTFPHTLFRVMLVEQVYRAFMINANSEYHK